MNIKFNCDYPKCPLVGVVMTENELYEHLTEFHGYGGSAASEIIARGKGGSVTNLEKEIEKAVELLGKLVDADDCYLDHHGNCQAHGYTGTCPMPEAKEFIERNRHKT
jgi:hypothetical protein